MRDGAASEAGKPTRHSCGSSGAVRSEGWEKVRVAERRVREGEGLGPGPG